MWDKGRENENKISVGFFSFFYTGTQYLEWQGGSKC